MKADSGDAAVVGATWWSTTIRLRRRALGIAAIYQQPALFPHLTVAENIALALEQRRHLAQHDWASARRKAKELMGRAGAAIARRGRLASR